MSRRESVQNLVGISDWPTQLAVLKVMFNTDDIHVKYLDDEDEEVKIDNQNDYEFANQIASCATNNILRLTLRNSRDEIVGKANLAVDLTSKSNMSLENSAITSSIDSMRSSIERIMPPPPPSNSSSSTTLPIHTSSSNTNINMTPFTPAQLAWLDNHLGKFKSELIKEINSRSRHDGGEDSSDLISFVENETSASLESKIQRLFPLIDEARRLKRSLRAAYLEEELLSTGVFMAEFIKDQNMPDGSECEPGMRFDKTWLIRNVGKLDWCESKFPVRLVCIAGNIAAVDDVDCVVVPETRVSETASISVALIAPPTEGTYFSEWVLCCNDFKFGPRIWCTIQVTGSAENQEQLSLATSIYSEKASKISQKKQQLSQSLASPEDMDDEFVVIPDCFDLDKKWKQKTSSSCSHSASQIACSTINSSKPSSIINELGFHSDDDFSPTKSEPEPPVSSIDLIMLESDPAFNATVADEKSLKQLSDLTVNKSSLESSIERINAEPCETEPGVKQQESFTRLLGEKLSLSETEDPKIGDFDEDEQIIETPRGANRLSELAAAVVSLSPERVAPSTSNTHVNSNISQAFGYMKDALSNLGRPSYVGSIQLANETESDFSMEDNLKKLVSMGFCNRQLNLKLLKKHNNDLNKVVQNILETTDNNWAENR